MASSIIRQSLPLHRSSCRQASSWTTPVGCTSIEPAIVIRIPKGPHLENPDLFASARQQGNKWIVIDLRGKTVPDDNKKIHVIGPYSEGLPLASDNGLAGWVDAEEHLGFPLRKYQRAAWRGSRWMTYTDISTSRADGDREPVREPGRFRPWAGARVHQDGFAYIDTKANVVW